MREIKYDAIYKPTGEHFVPININFNDKSLTVNFDGKFIDWLYFSLDGKTGDVILREYTGLKDKKGKEIYEGDIVDVDNTWRNKVEFYKGCFMVDEDVLGAIHSFSEVIGNIYVNPELLEGETHV
ncbi:hypothetical protein GLV94_03070 [Virgibacillus halodenitrificans]|uniref:YopX family protein n=1 Tax=Virgibacillus halodenitrificans TaxID=1482 RepID=UPI00136DD8C0|nr:YopX family protein [Virgibacillus halodenitrificans]MYL44615.1 hypothetical protein [Virgibacillus halodenitrificans]